MRFKDVLHRKKIVQAIPSDRCAAKVYGDQMHCDRCGYTWDMSDRDRPQCMTLQELGNAAMADIKKALQE